MSTAIEKAGSNGPPSGIIANERGLQLNTMEAMWWFANRVVVSGLAPRGLEKVEAAFVAIQMGAELGLSPMASLQNIAVINGRPSVWGDAMPALCINSGKFDCSAFKEWIDGDGDKATAHCTVKRVDSENAVTRTFSVAEAKQAGLWGKQGPWTQYPRRMLQMRARSFALRDTFPDVLRGFISVEEAREIIQVVEAVRAEDVQEQTATERLAKRVAKPKELPAEAPPPEAPAESPEAEPFVQEESKIAPVAPEITAADRCVILLAETCECSDEVAVERLERYAQQLYRKRFANLTARGFEEAEAKIRRGDIKVEAPATT